MSDKKDDLTAIVEGSTPGKDSIHHAVIHTELGDICLELYASQAPVTVSNFERLVADGAYNHSSFYRTVHDDNQPDDATKINVIQGGLRGTEREGKYPCISHETTDKTGVKNLDGVIAMARLKPGSASREFFICIGDQPGLDYEGSRNPDGQGFAAFGKVTSGMEIVRTIQRSGDEGQYLTNPIKIYNIELIDQ